MAPVTSADCLGVLMILYHMEVLMAILVYTTSALFRCFEDQRIFGTALKDLIDFILVSG